LKLIKLSSFAGAALLASAAMFSSSAFADSATAAAGAATTAAARLDFQITIPRVLQFRVGTAAAGTIDMLSFAPTAAQVGSGTALAGTGGDLTGGVVTAKVVGNNGQVSITAATTGALNDGGTNTIPWTQITTTATTLTSATALAAPVIPATGTGTAVSPPATGSVTNLDARWTFGYANTTVPAAGTYGGTVLKNGRVTYTASMQ